ncbi:MAG: protein-glutamate O-methyltransferase CheR [Candidatus Heimdallarchaeota archaeon]|nr:protein-glutamate O-methyltransferase CheR [Candidatus Heimdallarchaeota archaeon]
MSKDKDSKRGKRTILSILDDMENIDDLDEILSLSQVNEKVNIEIKPSSKIEDFFKVDPSIAKSDPEEYRRQIQEQKERYLAKIRKKKYDRTVKPRINVRQKQEQAKHNIRTLFGDEINNFEGDTDELKKLIKQRKEAYINNIRKSKREKEEDPAEMKSHKELDPFSDSLFNMDIAKLRMELDNRKKEYKKTLKSGRLDDFAKDISYLEAILVELSNAHVELIDYKPSFIYRRIKGRLMNLKLDTLEEYLEYIKTHKEEIDALKKKLSINVTKFFRDRATWDYLEKEILTKLIMKNPTGIRAWSAAAAIGSEAYSIAMLFDKKNFSNVSIIATDINPKLLQKAKKARYDRSYLSTLDAQEVIQYFDHDDGEYTVKMQYRSKVHFRQLDLLKDKYPDKFDIVFARNIWIYFENPEKVYMRMYHAMNPGAYLVLGATESVPQSLREKFKLISPRYQTYQKA